VADKIYGLETKGRESIKMRTIGIMYHDVVEAERWSSSGFPGAGADVYKISTQDFEDHLDHLKISGIEPGLVTQKSAPDDGDDVFITFDDGGESAFTEAADILEAHGWRGHFFVATAYIGTETFLKSEQIRELHERGHIIGSHSDTHPTRMAYCTQAEMSAEWGDSVKKLSDIIGDKINTASVPGGFFSRAVAETASAAGIEYLFNSEPVSKRYRIENCEVIGRYTVQQGISAANFERLAHGDRLFQMAEYLRWNSKKVAKKLGGKLYLDLRRRIFEGRKTG